MKITYHTNEPDWTMAEADTVFSAVGYRKPRGVTYPEAWRELQNRCEEFTTFQDQLETAIQKYVRRA